MNEKVNYNQISSQYDQRYEASPLIGILNSLKNVVRKSNVHWILEIGCGTGYWLNNFTSSEICFGVDSSFGMLKEAKKNNPKLNLICADANKLPFVKKRFYFIYCINAIHHFRDKEKFVSTSSQLLISNGIFSIYGLDPSLLRDQWYIYDYFKGTFERDLKRFPTLKQLKSWMKIFRLKEIEIKLVEQVNNDIIGSDVLNDSFLRKEQSSQLALLSNEEYKIGIDKIRHDISSAEKENKTISFPVKLNFYSVTGKKI